MVRLRCGGHNGEVLVAQQPRHLIRVRVRIRVMVRGRGRGRGRGKGRW